ncbi:MAG: hypothetical protein RIR26_1550, partial [Pseudomonadota bacterium]
VFCKIPVPGSVTDIVVLLGGVNIFTMDISAFINKNQ